MIGCGNYKVAANIMSSRKVAATFGPELHALRRRLHLTQAEFGEKLGLSQGAIAQLERGATSPSGPFLVALRALFHMEWNEEDKKLDRAPTAVESGRWIAGEGTAADDLTDAIDHVRAEMERLLAKVDPERRAEALDHLKRQVSLLADLAELGTERSRGPTPSKTSLEQKLRRAPRRRAAGQGRD